MQATLLIRRRIAYSASSFAELVLWRLPKPVPGCTHSFKYRLAFVVRCECVLRYDNESGKGDHRYYKGTESFYAFETPDELLSAFQQDITRYRRENSDA